MGNNHHPKIEERAAHPEPDARAKRDEERRNIVAIYFPRWALLAVAVLLLTPWLVAMLVWREPEIRRPASGWSAATARMTGNHKSGRCRPGPWGELEYTRVLIEPPEEYISSQLAVPGAVQWFFKGFSQERLTALLDSAGLTPSQRQSLADTSRWKISPEGITVAPDKDLILGLSSEARANIYTALAHFPENAAQYEPFRFRADIEDEWFEDSGLSENTVNLVKRLLYRRGTSLLFSDHDLVLPLLPSDDERIKLVKTLARKSTILLKLRVRADSNIDALAAYWGRGGRSKDVKPILKSIARHREGFTIDVAHLLPAFARMRLYTYPLPAEKADASNWDCHWTSLNFFSRESPNDQFSDIQYVKKTIETDYYPVPGDPAFGDVMLFIRPDGTVIHSCVYIADDIVFTKNGANFAMPWILMSLSDVIAFYPSDKPLQVRAYRHRQF